MRRWRCDGKPQINLSMWHFATIKLGNVAFCHNQTRERDVLPQLSSGMWHFATFKLGNVAFYRNQTRECGITPQSNS
jgi:demethoxyubiquinone hydroxylase (CLK1/Coq7/Cat5 family)